jgi:hypothetical protein
MRRCCGAVVGPSRASSGPASNTSERQRQHLQKEFVLRIAGGSMYGIQTLSLPLSPSLSFTLSLSLPLSLTHTHTNNNVSHTHKLFLTSHFFIFSFVRVFASFLSRVYVCVSHVCVCVSHVCVCVCVCVCVNVCVLLLSFSTK